MKTYDIIIVGAGPGGLTAGIYAGRQGTKTLILDKGLAGGIGREVPLMENYPGFDTISGFELVEKMKLQCMKFVELHENEIVKNIEKNEDKFLVTTHKDEYCGKTIILATGSSHKHLEIPGEEEYLGKGVSYCATCDGALYKNKDIAVICASPKFEDEVTFLAGLANHIYLFTPYKETTLQYDNITHFNGLPASVDGDKKVASVTFKGEAIPVSGAFFLKDSINPGVLLSGLDMAGGHIIVDRTQMTNIDGVYAAGDCTGRPYQYAKAVGEGNVAVHSVLEYLKEHKDN